MTPELRKALQAILASEYVDMPQGAEDVIRAALKEPEPENKSLEALKEIMANAKICPKTFPVDFAHEILASPQARAAIEQDAKGNP